MPGSNPRRRPAHRGPPNTVFRGAPAAGGTLNSERETYTMKSHCAALIRLLIGASALACIGIACAATPADFLIRGVVIYTGADAPPFPGDVVITGDKIVYAGS